MCGIAGYMMDSRRPNGQTMGSVLKRLRHRGPDDCGWLGDSRGKVETGRLWKSRDDLDYQVVLLHRRPSLLDFTERGRQPMSSADGRYFVVFNGEIYNYVELRGELEQLGHRFRTRTDTEVLLAAYSQWGIKALRRFTGMFAFALLDTERRTVLLARDFFGIKPLYYSCTSAGLSFASEIKALREFDLAPEVN